MPWFILAEEFNLFLLRNSIQFIFIQGMRFVIIPYNSDYYNFESQSHDSVGQSIENGYSILLQFATNEHVLNFISMKNVTNNQLQHAYENQIFFPKLKDQQKRVL